MIGFKTAWIDIKSLAWLLTWKPSFYLPAPVLFIYFFSNLNFAEGVARANDLAAAVDADDSEVERNIEIQQRVEGQPAAYVNHAMED